MFTSLGKRLLQLADVEPNFALTLMTHRYHDNAVEYKGQRDKSTQALSLQAQHLKTCRTSSEMLLCWMRNILGRKLMK